MRRIAKNAWLLAIVSGLLQVLIFPSINWYVLCWIAFAPLIVAVLRTQRAPDIYVAESLGATLVPATLRQAFVLGWLSGIIWCAGTCYWVYHVMHAYGGLNQLTSAGILVLFCLYIGAHNGLFALLLAWIAKPRNAADRPITRTLVAAPFLWVAVELLRTKIVGFPWDLLGTVQVDNIPLARIATVTGVYGISFEIMVVNTAFAAAMLGRRQTRRPVLAAAIGASVLVQATALIQPPRLPAPLTARLVQQNIPILDSDRWTSDYFQNTIEQLREKSIPQPEQTMGAPRPTLIVWPESPAPFYVGDSSFRELVSGMARQANAHVIVTSLGTNNSPAVDSARELYNSAALVTPEGEWTSRYDKIHLVPFGEYVPFKQLLVFAEKLTREVGEYVPGTSRNVFPIDGYKVGTFICYESIFPGEIREFARNGANVFVNVSNDGWYGRWGAPEQHLAQARMRAVENKRWLLRATNTGITASIDSYGRIIDEAPREMRTYLDAPFATVEETTFYTRHGDWFPYLCAIISVVALAAVRIRSRRTV